MSLDNAGSAPEAATSSSPQIFDEAEERQYSFDIASISSPENPIVPKALNLERHWHMGEIDLAQFGDTLYVGQIGRRDQGFLPPLSPDCTASTRRIITNNTEVTVFSFWLSHLGKWVSLSTTILDVEERGLIEPPRLILYRQSTISARLYRNWPYHARLYTMPVSHAHHVC